MKLRFRILLSCIVCVLLALLIQTFLFKETSSEMIYNLSREESENSLKNMQEEIYQFTGNMEKNLIKVYGEQDLINALKDESYTIERLREDFYRKAYDRMRPHMAEEKYVVFHDGFQMKVWKEFLTQRQGDGALPVHGRSRDHQHLPESHHAEAQLSGGYL